MIDKIDRSFLIASLLCLWRKGMTEEKPSSFLVLGLFPPVEERAEFLIAIFGLGGSVSWILVTRLARIVVQIIGATYGGGEGGQCVIWFRVFDIS